MQQLIEYIIKPETDLEKQIVCDPEFSEGVMWGKPRNGHPEGQVIYHIGYVLANIDKYATPKTREKLRLIAIVHDSFKYKVDRTKQKDGENHHAMLARRFAERYIDDQETLELIELHDEAYLAWCKGNRNNKWEAAEQRAQRLIMRLGDSYLLYLVFYKCDCETGDKCRENFNWFVKQYNCHDMNLRMQYKSQNNNQ